MPGDWFAQLTRVRLQLRISQAELSRRSHVSVASIKAYESGRRHPSRPYLTAILDALKLDRTARSEILDGAGFASDWQTLTQTNAEVAFTLNTARSEVDALDWPAFVTTEMSEVLVANDLVQRLWGVDLRLEYPDVADRSLLAVASNPRFADRCVNWNEAVGTLVAIFKGHHRGPEDLANPSPVFRSMMERFLKGDRRYVARFARLWQEVPPRVPELRWHYPVVWDDPVAGRMTFDCVASSANERDGWAFNDWIPVGPESWSALQRLP